jgi:hypothetical protein
MCCKIEEHIVLFILKNNKGIKIPDKTSISIKKDTFNV